MNTLDAIKNLKENSELLNSELDTQIEELRRDFLPRIVTSTLGGNPILKIMVIEDLYKALHQLLTTEPCTPEMVRSIASGENDLSDEHAAVYATEVNRQLSQVVVESNKLGAFLPQSEVLLQNGGPLEIFIRVLTKNDAATLELNNFLEKSGTANFLRQSMIDFSMEEIKLAYLVSQMLASMSQAAQQPSVLLQG